jgi:hypothetical protein
MCQLKQRILLLVGRLNVPITDTSTVPRTLNSKYPLKISNLSNLDTIIQTGESGPTSSNHQEPHGCTISMSEPLHHLLKYRAHHGVTFVAQSIGEDECPIEIRGIKCLPSALTTDSCKLPGLQPFSSQVSALISSKSTSSTSVV